MNHPIEIRRILQKVVVAVKTRSIREGNFVQQLENNFHLRLQNRNDRFPSNVSLRREIIIYHHKYPLSFTNFHN